MAGRRGPPRSMAAISPIALPKQTGWWITVELSLPSITRRWPREGDPSQPGKLIASTENFDLPLVNSATASRAPIAIAFCAPTTKAEGSRWRKTRPRTPSWPQR